MNIGDNSLYHDRGENQRDETNDSQFLHSRPNRRVIIGTSAHTSAGRIVLTTVLIIGAVWGFLLMRVVPYLDCGWLGSSIVGGVGISGSCWCVRHRFTERMSLFPFKEVIF
jgi:hypothetical protein